MEPVSHAIDDYKRGPSEESQNSLLAALVAFVDANDGNLHHVGTLTGRGSAIEDILQLLGLRDQGLCETLAVGEDIHKMSFY